MRQQTRAKETGTLSGSCQKGAFDGTGPAMTGLGPLNAEMTSQDLAIPLRKPSLPLNHRRSDQVYNHETNLAIPLRKPSLPLNHRRSDQVYHNHEKYIHKTKESSKFYLCSRNFTACQKPHVYTDKLQLVVKRESA